MEDTGLIAQDPALEAAVKKQVDVIAARSEALVSGPEMEAKVRKSLISGKPLKVKLGVDPSAPDLHLGHVVVMKKLREFQELGHEIYFVIGDFTGFIGDPSGRSQTRPQLTKEEIRVNAETYREQAVCILDPAKTHTVFNSSWLAPLTFTDIIHLGARFTVARMMERDDFQNRYSSGIPIGIHEFLYPLAQAYDSVAVKADVELGGTDQTFNLLVGRVIQKEFGQEPQVALTMPLLVGLDGTEKMSKSLGNYIAVKDSAKDMYGKAMSIPDSLMPVYFSLVLLDDEATIRQRQSDIGAGKVHPMDVKMSLARRITGEFHGQDAAHTAEQEFLRVFREGDLPEHVPEVFLDDVKVGEDVGLAWLLARCELAPSAGEARRLIEGGGVKVDGEKAESPGQRQTVKDGLLLQVGKRRVCKVRVT